MPFLVLLFLLLPCTPALAAPPPACPLPVTATDDGGLWLLPAALVVCLAGRMATPRRSHGAR